MTIACPNCGTDLRAMMGDPRDEDLGLTPIEGVLLETMTDAPARVFSRAELLVVAWGWPADRAEQATTHTVESTIRRLRQKLEAAGRHADIVPIRGRGYALVPLAEAHRA